MSLCWQLGVEDDLALEVHKKLERMKLGAGGTRTLEDHEYKHRIPKISRRSLFYLPKKHPEVYNKKTKKAASKNSSLHGSFLNLDEQFRINQNILELQNKLGVTIVQKNGQRKLGGPPPGWTGPPPGPGCEIFVGRIPRNIYEDEIYPIFTQIGGIYEMRLMMNFSGRNRGFCFIMYEKPELAQKAIKQLNNYQIRPGWFIGVVESVNNCRLHVTNLLPQTEAKTLIKRIWPVCEDIDHVSVFTNMYNAQIKHALISFKTHRSAAMARRRLLPERNSFFDKSEVRIEWAHPKISITDVIEEYGICDDNNEVIITTKIIGSDKKCFSEENANKTALRNARKKRSIQNSFRSRNLDMIKNVRSGVPHFQKVPVRKDNFNVHVDNVQSCNVNQGIYKQDCCENYNGFDDCMFKLFDEFKYSMRSDESLSDFSKNSDSDDSKNVCYCPSTSTPYNNGTPAYLNPTNCFVIRFPWKLIEYYPTEQPLNVHHQNTNFYNVQFPWKVMNFNNVSNMPVRMPTMQHNEAFNYAVPAFVNNNFNNVGNVRADLQVNRNARPILNRNLSS